MSDRIYSDFNALTANLQELYAVSQCHSPLKKVVPDPFGKRFYSSKSWLGRFLVFLYQRLDCFNETWRQEATLRIMERTHCLFYRLRQEALYQEECIKECFEAKMDGRYVNESVLRKYKQFLKLWNIATTPFLEVKNNSLSPQFKELIHLGFIDHFGRQQSDMPFTNTQEIEKFNHTQSLIDFECLLGSPLPMSALYKAACNIPLNHMEEKQMDKFIKKIIKNKIPINEINRLLRGIIYCCKKAQRYPQKPTLLNLTKEFVNKNYTIFNMIDKEHLAWRNTLKKGEKLHCNQIEVILGDPIGNQSENDYNVVFEVQNAPNLVAVFGINKFSHLLKGNLADRIGFCIPSARYLQIDKNGDFALIEKLTGGLTDKVWTSSNDTISPEDFNDLIALRNSINWCIGQNRIPAYFSPENLMYDVFDALKFTKLSTELPFDFNALEDFIWKIAAGNRTVYKFLMENSELNKHAHAQFYQTIIKAVCNYEDPNIHVLSQIRGIKDHRIVDRGIQLAQDATLTIENSLDRLRENYPNLPPSFRKTTGKLFNEIYKNEGSVSLLTGNMKTSLIKRQIDYLQSLQNKNQVKKV